MRGIARYSTRYSSGTLGNVAGNEEGRSTAPAFASVMET